MENKLKMSDVKQIHPLRLSISEAAKFFGLSDKSIREALKRKELKSIVIRGRYKINFESMLEWAQLNKRRQNKLKRDGLGQFVKTWEDGNANEQKKD